MKTALPALVLGVLVTSCAISTASKEPLDLPTYESFEKNNVSLMMEQRCGTLDCHGQVGRPLRLYGLHGLRLDRTKTLRDANPTSEAEMKENYLSVVGLEPELLAKVYKGGNYENFQLLLKPQGLADGMRHKGGQVVNAKSTDDDAWQCLIDFVAPVANQGDFGEICKNGARFH